MKGNILTLEVPRSYFSQSNSLVLKLRLTDIKDATCAVGVGDDSPWTVRRMIDWLKELADTKEGQGHLRTAETYRATGRRVRKMASGTLDVPFDARWLACFDERLRSDGLSLNTIGFYMKRLRAACNLARTAGHCIPEELFDAVYTSNAKTAKRAIDAATISRMMKMGLEKPMQRLARDLFLFSFYTRGMSFIDMAYLRASDIQHGILSYRRHKTGQLLSMAWLPQMETIVRRYHKEGQPYLLPIIKRGVRNERRAFQTMQFRVNHALKAIGEALGLVRPLTMYVARHSWASIAQANHVPLSVISTAMGHTSEHTTRIYLEEISANRVDEANERVINCLSPAAPLQRRGE